MFEVPYENAENCFKLNVIVPIWTAEWNVHISRILLLLIECISLRICD